MGELSIKAATAGRFIEFARSELDVPIHQRFERLAELYPNHTASQAGLQGINYNDLNLLANRMAHAILSLRDAREEGVAILADQGIPVLAFILGCLKAAKIYVPLDPDLPAASLSRLLESAGPGLIVCDRKNHPPATALSIDCPVLCLDPAHPGDFSARNPGLPISSSKPAYVYYTSGSTGEPKGVVDSHRNVMHNIMRYTNGLKIGPQDRLTLLQTPSFSGAVSSMFGALLNGAALFPINPRQESSASLAQWVRENELTMWHSVPSLFRQLCAAGGEFPSVRVIRLEGDQSSVSDVELFRRHFGEHCVLVNGLGATETGISRRYFVARDTSLDGNLVPVGYEVEDIHVTVINESGDTAPAGQTGEIAVRSDYLALGYWKRPDLTDRAFCECEDGSRLYRTGDLGRMRQDGCLEHLGRLDGRVKIRGNWVDLADIEGLLQLAPGVAQAVVRSDTGADGEKRLVGYVVPAQGQGPSVTSLRRHLQAKLAPHQIPTAFMVVEKLPLSGNGKIDRKALPSPDKSRPELEAIYEPARSESEQRLVEIWRQALDLDTIGVDDDFFELGGDSLSAARVVSSLNIDVAMLVEASTIRRLAQRLEADDERSSGQLVCFIRSTGERPPLFCIPGHSGVLVGYRRLGRLLPPEQPVVAFLPPPVSDSARLYSLGGLASRYVEEVLLIQPNGPILLSGLCFGGCVAYEMACQLRAQGKRVEALLLLECFNDRWLADQSFPVRVWARTALAVRRASFHSATVVRLEPRAGWEYFKRRIAAAIATREDAHGQRRFDRLVESGEPLPTGFSQAGFAGRAAARDWTPKSYDGRVVLLGGSEPRAGHYDAPWMGWAELLRGEVECAVFTDELKGLLAEPALHRVAERFVQEIDRVGSRQE